MLTGEADGIRKERRRPRPLRLLLHLRLRPLRRRRGPRGELRRRLAGEARAFRHPPSPLQEEVNRVIIACTYVMMPLAALLVLTLKRPQRRPHEAAQTATAGLVTLIPEGLVLLMSVTFAVAAVRLAKRDTLVQQMSATESLAAVDTICVDKTGTLTEGELRLAGVEFAEGVDAGRRRRRRWPASPPAPATATAPWRRSPSASPARPARSAPRSPSPRSGSGAASRSQRRRGGSHLRARRPRHPRRGRRPDPAAGARRASSRRRPPRGAASSPSASPAQALPADPAPRRRRGWRRWRWSCSRRRCAPTPPRRSRSCASRKST